MCEVRGGEVDKKDALADEAIKPYDPNQGKRFAKYLPRWA